MQIQLSQKNIKLDGKWPGRARVEFHIKILAVDYMLASWRERNQRIFYTKHRTLVLLYICLHIISQRRLSLNMSWCWDAGGCQIHTSHNGLMRCPPRCFHLWQLGRRSWQHGHGRLITIAGLWPSSPLLRKQHVAVFLSFEGWWLYFALVLHRACFVNYLSIEHGRLTPDTDFALENGKKLNSLFY